MKLIVGLGNPGIEYQFTLHNLGFLTIDRIAERCGVFVDNRHARAMTGRARIGSEAVLLAKPETSMNLSGMSVRELVAKHEIDPHQDLIVIYDDLDLPFGSLRVRPKGSPGTHNGMKSISGALDSEDFARIRIGIAPDKKLSDGAKYVLSQIKKSQVQIVDEALDNAADAVEVIITQGIQTAMNRFNRKTEPEAAE